MSHDPSRRRSLPVLEATPTRAHDALAPAERRGAAAGLRVGLVTLGCDKNTVDSERLLAELLAAGARVSAEVRDADVVVVNTCGFIDIAREESVDAILDAVRLKQGGRVRAVVAMGCLVQRYREELRAELPEVDLLLGTTDAARLVPALQEQGVLPPVAATPLMERPLRVLTGATRHSSYLKISEGCDHACAFCAIPLMRGKHRSTPIERLVREARELDAAGVVELSIVSQDTTWYGRDFARGAAGAPDEPFFAGRPFAGMAGLPRPVDGGMGRWGETASGRAPGAAGPRAAGSQGHRVAREVAGVSPSPHLPIPQSVGEVAPRDGLLPELLRALIAETRIPWLRLFYLYPSGITRRLVECMAAEPRILPYVDMPIQHGADAVLRRMRRPERRATIRERVRWLRQAIPDVALRTTVIVGFPGETEEDFEALLGLMEELRFDHLGAFGYSVEEGTPAAAMPDQVSESLARERLERVLELQRAIALEKNDARVGRETPVLVDRLLRTERERRAGRAAPGAIAVARAPWQAPELDGSIMLLPRDGADGADGAGGADGADPRAGELPQPGALLRARIVEAGRTSEDDLVARILD